jgi:16S rRNA (cytosine1402-N4)-methyltransferase
MTDKLESIHRTVLLNETIEGLNLNSKSLVLDCTFGGGGHSLEICKRYPSVKIIALDQDAGTLKNKNSDCKIIFHNENFRDLDKVLGKEKVDAIIFDLGLSSDQLEFSGRGFSFLKNEPLLMTLKENPSPEDIIASDIVNTWSEESLAQIIYGYGEERLSRRIAKAIVDGRQKAEIKTTFDLVKIISDVVPAVYRRGRLHFATKTFQALRIAVNDELGVLKTGLESGFNGLKKGGRMAVISFHSLEDRIVKRFYQNKAKENKVILINKKPITASAEEIKNNSRSRSAKLRILEKI